MNEPLVKNVKKEKVTDFSEDKNNSWDSTKSGEIITIEVVVKIADLILKFKLTTTEAMKLWFIYIFIYIYINMHHVKNI
jgi:hypothetical protein